MTKPIETQLSEACAQSAVFLDSDIWKFIMRLLNWDSKNIWGLNWGEVIFIRRWVDHTVSIDAWCITHGWLAINPILSSLSWEVHAILCTSYKKSWNCALAWWGTCPFHEKGNIKNPIKDIDQN